MKLYLDDIRKCPDGWVVARTAEEAMNLLKQNNDITEVSLDHDLGTEKTGHDVVNFIEELVVTDPTYNPPKIHIHTSNPAGRLRMLAGVKNIQSLVFRRCTQCTKLDN